MNASTTVQDRPRLPTRDIAEQLLLASGVSAPVMITAPSADDREACARIIHRSSHGGGGLFVRLDGSSLEALAAGGDAPSGASDRRDAGADHPVVRGTAGTLYVDDITELDGTAQEQLLAWLEARGRFSASSRNGPADTVRLISGASRHLDRERASGTFSEPLFYRLNIIHVDLTGATEVGMKAREVMTTPPFICQPASNLAEVATMMWNHDCGFMAVVDPAGAVLGVVTDRDICIAAATRGRPPEHLTAAEVMSSSVHSVLPDDSLTAVLAAMKQFEVRRVPVIDANGQLQGVVSMTDIVLAAAERGGPPAKQVIAAMAAICAPRRRAVAV
jgi:CBS domain-containing protein